MKNGNKMTLEGFKNLLANDKDFVDNLVSSSDIIDVEGGNMIIHRSNINKYLEQYMCKSEEDLSDTLWYSYGMFVKVID